MQYIIPWHQKLYRWSCNFLLVQLFINLIAWPLFLGWGLPITPLSIVGNLIFSPFLTAFLMLSSLIVTCELIHIPHEICIYALEYLTTIWLWITACPTPNCMITFITPPLPLALCAPMGATWIITSKKFKTSGKKVMALLALYCILMVIFALHAKPASIEVAYGSHNVKIINKDEMLTLIDSGFTRRKASINQWVNYTLLPALGNSFGRQTVDQIILQKKSPTAHACAELLRIRGITKKVIVNPNTTTADAPSKTTPSFRAAPLNPSKNPSYRNRSYPRFQG